MDFLGKPTSELRKIKSQVIAMKALLTAMVQTLPPPIKGAISENFQVEAEKAKAELLNSMATDSFCEELTKSLAEIEKLLE